MKIYEWHEDVSGNIIDFKFIGNKLSLISLNTYFFNYKDVTGISRKYPILKNSDIVRMHEYGKSLVFLENGCYIYIVDIEHHNQKGKLSLLREFKINLIKNK
jgi:hypothetical protein